MMLLRISQFGDLNALVDTEMYAARGGRMLGAYLKQAVKQCRPAVLNHHVSNQHLHTTDLLIAKP